MESDGRLLVTHLLKPMQCTPTRGPSGDLQTLAPLLGFPEGGEQVHGSGRAVWGLGTFMHLGVF